MQIKRIGSVIGVKPEEIAEYERIHAQVWPGVLTTLKRANISNYSIFRYQNMLFSYMEYTGTDYEADMALIASDLGKVIEAGRLLQEARIQKGLSLEAMCKHLGMSQYQIQAIEDEYD